MLVEDQSDLVVNSKISVAATATNPGIMGARSRAFAKYLLAELAAASLMTTDRIAVEWVWSTKVWQERVQQRLHRRIGRGRVNQIELQRHHVFIGQRRACVPCALPELHGAARRVRLSPCPSATLLTQWDGPRRRPDRSPLSYRRGIAAAMQHEIWDRGPAAAWCRPAGSAKSLAA